MRAYILSIIVLGAVYFTHIWGMDGGYMQYRWLDILTHSAVSLGIALWLGAFVTSVRPRTRGKMGLIILGTFIFGFMWEVLEIGYNMSGYPLWSKMYYVDTVKDLCMDTIGGWLGAWIALSLNRTTFSPVEPASSQAVLESLKTK